jgi:1-acyl-sn-glycerol-3-phosphate acyltransferase
VALHGERHRPDDPRRPYVVVANHESFVDILLICHVPMEMKWMSKSEFFKIPLLGWGMRLAGDIRLERGDKKSGVAGAARLPGSARQATCR